MSISSIFGAIRNLFRSEPPTPISDFVAVTEAHKVKVPQKRNRAAGRWVQKALDQHDCVNTVIVKAPATLKLESARSSVKQYMTRRFGSGTYRTRIFPSRHTIHVSLK